MKTIVVVDMTKLFKKEFLLYSIFDKGIKRPLRVALILYYVVVFCIFSLPLLLLVKPLSVFTIGLSLVVPYAIANAMSKPIWGGKKFISWLKAQVSFIKTPKKYYDCSSKRELGDYSIYQEIVVSRTEDFRKLAKIRKERLENGKK